MSAMLLSIDQSTSATKAVLFDDRGAILDKASRNHRQIYPQPGWVEHDAEEIWRNTLAALGDLAARQDLSRLAGLSVTNQRETIVVFERGTGRPLHHAIVWQCRRGDPICRELREAGHEDAIRRRTGLKLDTYFSASKLSWLARQEPGLARKVREGAALIGTMDAYLIYRLTHGTVFATDATNASRTLLYDIQRLRWDEELCALFEVPARALPEVRDSSARFGETDAGGILPRRVPLCGVMGDSQASLFAQQCFHPGMVKATFGTGTSVLLNIGRVFTLPPEGLVTALAWVLHNKPTYAYEGIINFSAATVAWLKDQLGLIRDADETEALATAVEDSGGVFLVPAFAGLSAPYWKPEARAAILGLTAHTRREHIVRAALESIGYQLREVLDLMKTGAGVSVQSLHGDGGPTANRFLMQFVAGLCGAELRVSNVPESSAWGAASAGLLGLGLAPSLDALAALPRAWTTYQPRLTPEQARQLLEGWQAAVKRVI
ncbi:MAG TPA: glycerol kinase GlpK [Candidatus Paceibacterota bacterium]|nr:glycerol kinase GlpK [Candidatus Paceibacterota bacterium]